MDKGKMHKEVKVYFIIPTYCKSEEYVSNNMKMAFQEVTEAGLAPLWQKEEDCDQANVKKNTVFVLQEFIGELFEKLRSTKSLVCGPMCIRSCIAEGHPIPENKSPVFTIAMRDLVISASQVPTATKRSLKEKVGFMGGIYMNSMTESVTHLVANTVRSAKYETAIERNIPIMTLEWVEAVWRLSQEKNIKATDPAIVAEHRCPIFFNMFITTSNLSKKEKDELKKLINDNGGTFTAQLQKAETTLLVINEPRGEKYKHARSWELPCVRSSYIYESVKQGFALPSKDHLISPTVSCSTPTKDEDPPNFTYNNLEASLSMININTTKTNVEESQLTNSSIVSTATQSRQPSKCTGGQEYVPIINDLNISDAKNAGSFVDGCKIYLSGFTTMHAEKLKRIVSLGGGTMFSELNENVSHIVAGDFLISDMKILQMLTQKPHVVTVEWLVASIKQRCPASEDAYTSLETRKVVPEPQSPLSQKGLRLLQPNQQLSETLKMPPPAEPPVNRKLFSEFCREYSKSPAKKPADTTKTDSIISTEEDSILPEIFKDLNFLIAGFDEELTNNIEAALNEAGGTVVAASFTGVADYAVVPMHSAALNITALEVVTHLWVEDCLDKAEILPLQYFHQPLSVDPEKSPLEGCCVTLSNFFAKEKMFLIDLIHMLGATYQDTFARVPKPSQGVLASTHLVCPKTEGQKYAASVKWNLPAVTKDWLLGCARHGVRLAESQYLVTNEHDKSTRTDQSSCKPKPVSTPSRVSAGPTMVAPTPAATVTASEVMPVSTTSSYSFAESVTPGSHRAVSSLKRKSSFKFSDELSPFHIATPDTPYGQVFETPTAETKKRWKKFIDDFPSKSFSPPPTKSPRRQSTPLSELKRRIWANALGDSPVQQYSDGKAELNPRENESCSNQQDNGESPENTNPRQMGSSGRAAPVMSDFTPALTSVTPLSHQKRKNKKESESKLKTPANEIVSAVERLQRLSTSSSASCQRLPQRKLVSSDVTTPPLLQPERESQDTESQPIFLGWEDPVETAERANIMNKTVISAIEQPKEKPRKYLLSNVAEKDKYEEMLSNLGESVATNPDYDRETTHLIVDEPLRSEKMLCSLAAGIWVLHTSFINHMSIHQKYVADEELFEWGNPKSEGRLPLVTGLSLKLASASSRWRKKLQAASGTGAFTGVRAVIFGTPSKQQSYERLIRAGCGEILAKTSYQMATHCFVEEKKVNLLPAPVSRFVSLGIPCLMPIFLGDMLIVDPPPSVENGLIPQYSKLSSEKNV